MKRRKDFAAVVPIEDLRLMEWFKGIAHKDPINARVEALEKYREEIEAYCEAYKEAFPEAQQESTGAPENEQV